VPVVLAPEQTPYLAVVVIGLITGLGILFVKPAPSEPDKLDRTFPMARFYQYAAFRRLIALISFGFAAAGLAFMLGWL